MYKEIMGTLPLPLKGSVLGISGLKYWKGSRNYTPPQKIIDDTAKITEVDYPEVEAQHLPFKDNVFDWVICDQVLEHVEGNPQKVISEMHRVLKSGGTAIIATGFIAPVHYGSKDMWRFSPDGLRYLCRDFGKILSCNGWGNRIAHTLFFIYGKSRDWEIPERKLSLLHFLATKNNEKYPLHTWIVVSKK